MQDILASALKCCIILQGWNSFFPMRGVSLSTFVNGEKLKFLKKDGKKKLNLNLILFKFIKTNMTKYHWKNLSQ